MHAFRKGKIKAKLMSTARSAVMTNVNLVCCMGLHVYLANMETGRNPNLLSRSTAGVLKDMIF